VKVDNFFAEIKWRDVYSSSSVKVGASNGLFAQVRRGNIDEAFACLPEVLKERDWFALQLRVNPMRDDPRFETLMQKVVGPNTQ
jgi:hypothetical protein